MDGGDSEFVKKGFWAHCCELITSQFVETGTIEAGQAFRQTSIVMRLCRVKY